MGGTEKKGGETKTLKSRGKLGQKVAALNGGRGTGTSYNLWYIGKLILWALLFFVIFFTVIV